MSYEKPDHITFKLRTFSNDEIDALLEMSDNFRSFKDTTKQDYLKTMLDGGWDCGNGETISIATDGTLVNGQHRLSAARDYQSTTKDKMWFWCAMGVEKKSSLTVDGGKKRTLVDYLLHEKVQYANYVAAIVAAQARVASMSRSETNTLACVAVQRLVGSAHGKSFTFQPSISFCLDQFRRHRGSVIEWAAIGAKMSTAGLLGATGLAALGFQLAKAHQDEARVFFDDLISGANLKPGDPILVLREKIRKTPGSKKGAMKANYISAVAVKAWVAWNEGRQILRLSWAPTGPAKESFPDHRFQKPA